jgi:spermidine/putrescine-binding protein
MKNGVCKSSILRLICLSLLLFISSCQKSAQSESYDILSFSDETTAAAEQVADANEDLNKIKVIYKRNESKREELKEAMKANDAESVKKSPTIWFISLTTE